MGSKIANNVWFLINFEGKVNGIEEVSAEQILYPFHFELSIRFSNARSTQDKQKIS